MFAHSHHLNSYTMDTVVSTKLFNDEQARITNLRYVYTRDYYLSRYTNYPKITYVVGSLMRPAKQPYITSPVEEVQQVLLCSVGAFGQCVLCKLSVVLAVTEDIPCPL